ITTGIAGCGGPPCGRSMRTACVCSGSVMIRSVSRTSITSIKGVVLISAMTSLVAVLCVDIAIRGPPQNIARLGRDCGEMRMTACQARSARRVGGARGGRALKRRQGHARRVDRRREIDRARGIADDEDAVAQAVLAQ